MTLSWPTTPHNGGRLTRKLTESNYRRASLLRRFDNGVLALVSVVKLRYFDRGAGAVGPGYGGGAWINEGSVRIQPYPLSAHEETNIPPMVSVMGWRWDGTVPTENGVTLNTFETKDEYLKEFQEAFWAVFEAIDYANSVRGSSLADHSEVVDPAQFRKLRKAS